MVYKERTLRYYLNLINWKFNPYLTEIKFLTLYLLGSKKLVIGASKISQFGWMPSEQSFLDVSKQEDWSKYFKKNYLRRILAEHVWEHINSKQGKEAIRLCYSYLRKGGLLRIAVPDGYHTSKKYLDQVRPNGPHQETHGHRMLYNIDNLSKRIKEAGFTAIGLEYFDKNGNFHKIPWKESDGMIMRSLENDDRNKNGRINYTSLIVDAFKK